MRLVDRTLKALVAQCGLREHRGSSDRSDQHRVRLRADHPQRLAGHALVGAIEAFRGDDFDACFFSEPAEHLEPVVAVRIGKPDEGDGFDVALRHMLQQCAGDEIIVLRRLEYPAFLGVNRLDDGGRSHGRHHRHFRFGDHIEDRERVRCRRWANQCIDIVFLYKLLDVLHGACRIAAIFQRNVFDGHIADFLRQDVAGVLLRNADRRRRTRRRDHQSNPDLRKSGGGKA